MLAITPARVWLRRIGGTRSVPWRLWRLVRAPPRVGRRRLGLDRAHIPRADVGEDAVLRRDGGASQPPQHRELPHVRHGVGQGALQELLVADLRREARIGEVISQGSQRVVEALYLRREACRTSIDPTFASSMGIRATTGWSGAPSLRKALRHIRGPIVARASDGELPPPQDDVPLRRRPIWGARLCAWSGRMDRGPGRHEALDEVLRSAHTSSAATAG